MGQITVTLKPWKSHTMGIELECYPEKDSIAYKNMDKYSGFWFITEDGSLAFGKPGREIISQPMPYQRLVKQIDKLPFIAGNWDVDTKCGIHVHVSKSFMSLKRVDEYRNAFVRSEWTDTALISLFGRPWNTYCSPTPHRAKYSTINIMHNNTYEFRMFRSGDKEWAKECVRRTYLMATYKGPITVQALKALFGIEEKKEEPKSAVTRYVRIGNSIVTRTTRETASLGDLLAARILTQ